MGRNFYLVNHNKELLYDLGSSYSFKGINITDIFTKFKWDIKDQIEIMDDQSYEFDQIFKNYFHINENGEIEKIYDEDL